MTQEKNVSNEPVTAVFNWTVQPGEERAFQHMLHDIHKVARTFPGHMGVTTLRSPVQKGNFQTVLRYDNVAHLEAWLNSPIRHKLMEPINEIAHAETPTEATGLETWFNIPGSPVTPPPRWKMAMTTFIAIYPLSLIVNFFVLPLVTDWPTAVRALILSVAAPIILTYLFMPFLTQRVLKRWLYTSIPAPKHVEAVTAVK